MTGPGFLVVSVAKMMAGDQVVDQEAKEGPVGIGVEVGERRLKTAFSHTNQCRKSRLGIVQGETGPQPSSLTDRQGAVSKRHQGAAQPP
jgi:hypothetical protein